MDYRGLIFLPLALIDQSAAINLHGNRAATERRAQADLIGGAGGTAYMGVVLNTDPLVAPNLFWQFFLYVKGDQTDRYDLIGDSYTFNVNAGPSPALAVSAVAWTDAATHEVGLPDPGVCTNSIATPDGYTTINTLRTGPTPPDGGAGPGTMVATITRDSDGAIMDDLAAAECQFQLTFPNWGFWHQDPARI